MNNDLPNPSADEEVEPEVQAEIDRLNERWSTMPNPFHSDVIDSALLEFYRKFVKPRITQLRQQHNAEREELCERSRVLSNELAHSNLDIVELRDQLKRWTDLATREVDEVWADIKAKPDDPVTAMTKWATFARALTRQLQTAMEERDAASTKISSYCREIDHLKQLLSEARLSTSRETENKT